MIPSTFGEEPSGTNKIEEAEVKQLAEARLAYILLNWRENLDNTKATSQDIAKNLIAVLEKEFGYVRQLFPQPLSLSRIDAELYWQIKAILRGVQMEQQNNPNITWGTTLDAVLRRMNELEEASQPLDDKELEKAVFDIVLPRVCRLRPEADIKGAQQAQLITDEVVALLQQKIEEARRQERERMMVELTERIRVDDEGAVIIRVGTQGKKGVEFNDWWRVFRGQAIKGGRVINK